MQKTSCPTCLMKAMSREKLLNEFKAMMESKAEIKNIR